MEYADRYMIPHFASRTVVTDIDVEDLIGSMVRCDFSLLSAWSCVQGLCSVRRYICLVISNDLSWSLLVQWSDALPRNPEVVPEVMDSSPGGGFCFLNTYHQELTKPELMFSHPPPEVVKLFLLLVTYFEPRLQKTVQGMIIRIWHICIQNL